jgi:hypothetical protein
MKNRKSLLNNLLLTILLLLLAAGAGLNSISRTYASVDQNIQTTYRNISNILFGIPFLSMGFFFLLPRRIMLNFINNSWLGKISVNKYDGSSPRWFGVGFFIFGCLFIVVALYSIFSGM